MHKFDVVIIGGGPAGSSAGIELQKAGLKTCIIEKDTFPRQKLCGGLLTQKTIDLTKKICPKIDIESFVVDTTKSVEFYFRNDKVADFNTSTKYYYTERTLFDTELISEYKKVGGILYENQRVHQKRIDLEQQKIILKSEEIEYRFLIGADGCNSVLSKKCNIKTHSGFCLEGEVRAVKIASNAVRIYFGVAKKGYGWHFPKNDYICLGIGGDNSQKMISSQAQVFFSQYKNVSNIKGALIPTGQAMKIKNLPKNCIVVGDAAGFIDPITGEGIYLALLSGCIAAESIIQSEKNNSKNILKIYLKNISGLRKNISIAILYQKLFPLLLEWFMNHLKKRKSFATFYLENVLSTNKYNYQNFILKYLINKIMKKI